MSDDIKLTYIFTWRGGKPMIAIDRPYCFDKIWKCPILIPLPKTEKEINKLNAKIEWLKTDEGFYASQKFNIKEWMNCEFDILKS